MKKKQPLGREWQKHPYTIDSFCSQLNKGSFSVLGAKGEYAVRPKGVGLLCGNYDEEKVFLIAVDVDGLSAQKALPLELPSTICWTSGRPNRKQCLFKAPLGNYKNQRIKTGVSEALELRGTGCVSILPPSPHPLTGQYHWIDCPASVKLADAPSWVKDLMEEKQPCGLKPLTEKKYRPTEVTNNEIHPPTISAQAARLILELLPPSLADNHDSWLRIGIALHSVDKSLLEDWDRWSQSSDKYIQGECAYKWSKFRRGGITEKTLFWYLQHV